MSILQQDGKVYKEIDVAELRKEKNYHEKSIREYEREKRGIDRKIAVHQSEVDVISNLLPPN